MSRPVKFGENRAPREGVATWAGEWPVTVDGEEMAVIVETERGYRLRSPGGWVAPERPFLESVQDDAQELYGPREPGKSCGCENTSHFPEDGGKGHPYGGVPAGQRRAEHVGPVCDDCADTHMADYLINKRRKEGEA